MARMAPTSHSDAPGIGLADDHWELSPHYFFTNLSSILHMPSHLVNMSKSAYNIEMYIRANADLCQLSTPLARSCFPPVDLSLAPR